MSEELKPCPFCGGEAKVIKIPRGDRKYVAICENDLCMASVGNFSCTREDAVRKWNRRVTDER